MSFGAKRCTVGAGRLPSRSEKSCAEASMLRRSGLIFDTARPRSARWRCSDKVAWSSRCMPASWSSATPISSPRPLGTITLPGSSGASEKATMFSDSFRIGRANRRSRLR